MIAERVQQDAEMLDRLSPEAKSMVVHLIRRCALRGCGRKPLALLPPDIWQATKQVVDAFDTELQQGFEEWT